MDFIPCKAEEADEHINQERLRRKIDISFKGICDRCKTIGDLNKLTEEVRRIKAENDI